MVGLTGSVERLIRLTMPTSICGNGNNSLRQTWARNGMADKAITMFIDLRQWEEAKVFAASSGGSVDAKELTRRQAEWAEEVR